MDVMIVLRCFLLSETFLLAPRVYYQTTASTVVALLGEGEGGLNNAQSWVNFGNNPDMVKGIHKIQLH